MFPPDLLREPVWQSLTLTLLHFLWQGSAVAAGVATLLYVWPVRRAHNRYLICLSALIAMAVCPLVTVTLTHAPESATTSSREAEIGIEVPLAPDPGPGFVAGEMPVGSTGPVAREGHLPLERSETVPFEAGDSASLLLPVTWHATFPQYLDAIQPYCLLTWMAGVLLLAVRLSLSWLHVRWLAGGRRAIPADLAAKAATLGGRLGLRFSPRVCVSENIREAIVVGLWRPLVLLPASWLTEMPPEVLEAVIAHELAHVRRLDLWVNLLQRLMETLLFYHPAVWWLSRRVSLEREMCADELAVGATRERLAYATALEQLGRMRLGQISPQFGAGIGGKRMVLLSRVGNVLGLSASTKRARWWPVGLLALAVPAMIWAASMGIGSSTENETRAAEVSHDAISDEGADTLSLEARVVGIDGKPVQTSSIEFWRARDPQSVDASPQDMPESIFKIRRSWQDSVTKKVWEPIHSFAAGDRATKEKLSPGEYRVTAMAGRDGVGPLGVSGVIRLDGSQPHTVAKIQLEPGPALTVTATDAETGEVVKELVQVLLLRKDGLAVTEWSSGTSGLWMKDGRREFPHLAPGTYTLHVGKRAFHAGDPEYLADRIEVKLVAGKDKRISVPMRAVRLDRAEVERRWPWAVTGTVTDKKGRPLQGVELRSSCGIGSLMPTGRTVTDKQGKYTLRFGPGMRSLDEKTGKWGAGLQAATIFASKPGHTEENLCRQGGLMMADKLPPEDNAWGAKPETVILPGKPYRLDFVMLPAVSLEGKLVDAQGQPLADKRISIQGSRMPPSCSVLAQSTTDKEGRFRFEGVPADYDWWLSADGRTQPVSFSGSGPYRISLQHSRDTRYGLDLLRITSVIDPQGAEVRDRAVGDDPSARPPVSEKLQEQGREYLKKMSAACRDWIGQPPAEVKSYEYRFRMGDRAPETITVKDPSRAGRTTRQGIHYLGTPHLLAARPEKVVFRQVEIDGETILLRFLVQDGVKVAAGNGITGSFGGFFSVPLREGLLVLNKFTYQPIRTEVGGAVRETYSLYMGLGQGRFVPLGIHIEKGSWHWDWKFRVYQPGLWLLAESRSGDQSLIVNDEVRINGRPAVPMAQDGVSARGDPSEVEVAGRPAADRSDSQRLTVDLIYAEGNLRETPSFWIDHEQLDKEALRERVTGLFKASPGPAVVVRSNREMPHKHVAELLALLTAVGVKNVSVSIFPLDSVFAIDPGPGRNGTIRGKVIAPGNRGQPAKYTVTLEHEKWRLHSGELPNLVVSAGETFEFRNVPSGECTLRASQIVPVSVNPADRKAAAVGHVAEVEVTVVGRRVVEVELSVAPPAAAPKPAVASIAGRVTDADGKPVAAALIEWGHYDDPPSRRQRTRTDAEGRYRLQVTDFGVDFRLGVSAPGMAPKWQVPYRGWVHLSEPTRDEEAVPAKRMDFQLEPMHWIAGTVVDRSGKPIEGVRIGVRSAVEGFYSSFSSPTPAMLLPGDGRDDVRTDAAGRFRLTGLPATHVQLSLSTPHRHVNDQNYAVDKEHRIAMSGSGRPGIIRAQVVDARTGKPVEQFNVARRYDPKQRQIMSADGRFQWDDVHTEGGSYEFHIYSRDHAPVEVDVRAVWPGSQEETLIKLSPGSPLVATLIDAQSGKPLAGVPVLYALVEDDDRYFEWPDRESYIDGHHGLTLVQRAVSGDDGGFWFSEADDVPQGTLFVIAPGYERTIIRPQDRPAPSDSKRVQFALHREASITGVLARNGRPEPNVNVSIWKGGPQGQLEQWFEEAVTDSQGRYRFGRLAPGTYRLTYGVQVSPSVYTYEPFATATLDRSEQRVIRPADEAGVGELSANPIRSFSVGKVDPGSTWGQPVEGVQVRLRCDRPRWRADETITWKIDARNNGRRHLNFTPLAYESVKIDVDGRLFSLPAVHNAARSYELKPGQEQTNVDFEISRRWQLEDHPFQLEPGKHTVTITLGVGPAKGQSGDRLQVTSNPVEIQIDPAQPATGGSNEATALPDGPQAVLDAYSRCVADGQAAKLREILCFVDKRDEELFLAFSSGSNGIYVGSEIFPSGKPVQCKRASDDCWLVVLDGGLLLELRRSDGKWRVLCPTPGRQRMAQAKLTKAETPRHLRSEEIKRVGNESEAQLERRRTRYLAALDLPGLHRLKNLRSYFAGIPTTDRATLAGMSPDEFRQAVVLKLDAPSGLRYRVTPEAESFVEGEPVWATFLIENVTSEPIKLKYGPAVEIVSFSNAVTARGAVVFPKNYDVGRSGKTVHPFEEREIAISPGQTYSTKVDLLNHYALPSARYTISARFDAPSDGADGSWQGSAMANTVTFQTKPAPKPAAVPSKITVRGQVVDDATGKPVADFMRQGGKFDPADPAKVVWGYSETRSSRRSGKFTATVRWSEGWTARILAAGYLPQPILTKPPAPGQDVIDVVIRLRRGEMIRGRVLDHTGQGVAKAGIYLAGRGVIGLAEGPWNEFQGPSVRTDAEGRFQIGGRGEDSKAIFVSAGSLFAWRADLPQPGQEATIRLPEPARLHMHYDIEGGPSAAQVRIELRTWDMPKWKALFDVVRWVDVKAGEDGLVVDNLPPGVYDVSRIKHARAGNSGKDMMLDRQLKLTLTSGKTTAYDFVRKTGTPIGGDVVGLPKEGVNGVYVHVRDRRASGDPRKADDWKLRTFDGLAMEGNGPFKTERIAPGKYKVVATAYRQETRGEMSRTGIRLPKWTGTADVDVLESGEPPKVRLMMRSYDAH